MWPFSKAPKPPVDWAERIEALERSNRRMVVEWEEWYDKYRQLYARLTKRVKDAEKAQAAVESSVSDSGPGQDGRTPAAPTPANPLAQRLLNPYGGPR